MSITLTKNAESQQCTKHIDVLHYYICKLIKKREITVI